jgi:hypothetical protein
MAFCRKPWCRVVIPHHHVKPKGGEGMAAKPQVSEGARLQRRALRDKIGRTLLRLAREQAEVTPEQEQLGELLFWVNNRRKRYDAKPGGLGRK